MTHGTSHQGQQPTPAGEQSLPARYAAAVQRGRDIAREVGAAYDEHPTWRANERTVEALWQEARATGHTVAELMNASAIKADG